MLKMNLYTFLDTMLEQKLAMQGNNLSLSRNEFLHGASQILWRSISLGVPNSCEGFCQKRKRQGGFFTQRCAYSLVK